MVWPVSLWRKQSLPMLINEVCAQFRCLKGWVGSQAAQEVDVRDDSGDAVAGQCLLQALQRHLAVLTPNDKLRNHWVIEHAYLVVDDDPGIHTNMFALLGLGQPPQLAGCW